MLLVLLAVLIILLIVLPLIGLALWAIVTVGIVGVVIGGLARLILPGQQNVGVLATVLLGWIGSIVGGFIGDHVLGTGWFLTVVLEVAVAAALIAGYGASTRGRLNNGRGLSRNW
jgi:uncharacterized membrane protein YeaQ/YmgE (transglycosylase-associated protein family)